MIKKKVIFIAILLLAFLLRFYRLAEAPPSLNWDETSIGWNAYSLLQTGSDEYGNDFPVSIRSFNDYKPPLYTYLTVPSIAIFGLTEFAVRFPSALAGTLTVMVTSFLVKKLLDLDFKNYLKIGICPPRARPRGKLKIPLVAPLLLAVSPWHIQFSRIAFEASLGLFILVSGGVFLLKFLRKGNIVFLLLSAATFSLGFYTHHSLKVFLPLFLTGVFLLFHQEFRRQKRDVIFALILAGLILLPLGGNTFKIWRESRLASASIFASQNTPHLKGKPVWRVIAEKYLAHFGPEFLFVSGDKNPRHQIPGMGVLYWWDFPFIVVGLVYLVRRYRPASKILLPWLVVAPVAAMLTIDAPHASRTFFSLPVYQIIAAVGLIWAVSKFQQSYKLAINLIFISGLVISVFYYLHQYHLIMPENFARDWQYGYKQVVQKVRQIEDKYKRILITTAYDQPYVYFLFYGNANLNFKNNGEFHRGFGKYQFVNFHQSVNYLVKKGELAVFGPEDETLGVQTLSIINFPDSKPAIYLGEGVDSFHPPGGGEVGAY